MDSSSYVPMPPPIAKGSSHSGIGRLRKWPTDASCARRLPIHPLDFDFMSQRSSNMDLRQSIADWHIENHRSGRRYHPAPRISPLMPAWRMNHDSDVSLRSAAVLGDGHVTAWHPSKRCSSARCGRLRVTILLPGSAPNIDARGSRRRCRTNEVTGLGRLTSRQRRHQAAASRRT